MHLRRYYGVWIVLSSPQIYEAQAVLASGLFFVGHLSLPRHTTSPRRRNVFVLIWSRCSWVYLQVNLYGFRSLCRRKRATEAPPKRRSNALIFGGSGSFWADFGAVRGVSGPGCIPRDARRLHVCVALLFPFQIFPTLLDISSFVGVVSRHFRHFQWYPADND